MATSRTHIVLSPEMRTEIDQIVGPRERSAFVRETLAAEIKRRKLFEFLDNPEPAWKNGDHPEIEKLGSAGWVRMLRNQNGEREQQLQEWYLPVATDNLRDFVHPGLQIFPLPD